MLQLIGYITTMDKVNCQGANESIHRRTEAPGTQRVYSLVVKLEYVERLKYSGRVTVPGSSYSVLDEVKSL